MILGHHLEASLASGKEEGRLVVGAAVGDSRALEGALEDI